MESECIMKTDFLLIQDLVDCLCGVELHLVSNTRQGIQAVMRKIFQGMLPEEDPESALLRSLLELQEGCIYELSGPVDLQFSFFSCQGQLLVIGPCRTGIFTQAQMLQQLQPLRMKPEQRKALIDYCMQQPILSYEKLHRLMALIAQRLLGSAAPIPFQMLDYPWNAEQRRQILLGAEARQIDEIRIIEGRYEASAALTEAVKQGNLSLALHFIEKMRSLPEDLVRNPNPLRNAQNLCIILNTQLRHALEEEGIWAYRLDEISSGIARQIETFKTTDAANAYFGEILRQYCALAQEKAQKDLSPFARQAILYIKAHLSDNFSVRDAAKALLVNPDYLSARFHQETGIPMISYVNQQRVQQAAALLRRTDMQIQQIAAAVGYNNTSYFTRQFVKFQGMTPRAYRSGNHR